MSFWDPRERLVIHYYWTGQIVPILVHGLPSRAKAKARELDGASGIDWKAMPQPPAEAIRAISPYAQIIAGNYRTPTFLVNGDEDEQCPWEQSRDTIAALRAVGVEAGFAAPKGAGHAFDFYAGEDPLGTTRSAILEAYDFACRCLGLVST